MTISRRVAVPAVALAACALFAPAAPCPAGPADAPGPAALTLCLAAAGDDSPVYPLTQVPANHREVTVAFRLGAKDAFRKLTHAWTAVNVGDAAPAGTEVLRGTLDLNGAKHGTVKFSLPRDLPIGTYRLDVAADGAPWSKLDFSVVAPAPIVPIEKPETLLPLAVGTTWTHAFRLEVGAAVKKLSVSGAERGADGVWRATVTYKVAGKDDAGARVELRRNDLLLSDSWWTLDARGLGISRERAGEATTSYDPPVPILPLPLRTPATWTYEPKDRSFTREYRMWGPLPVVGPGGPAPGYVVLYKSSNGARIATTERHFVPGVGVVREVQVDAASGVLLTRIETTLVGVK